MSQKFDPYHKWLGIRPEEQPPNHYRLLGLQDFEDDPAVIENAADQRMAYLKTVQTGKHTEASQELLNEIVATKLCLLDVDEKVAYDATLRQRFTRTKPPALPVTAAVAAAGPPPLEAQREPAGADQPKAFAAPPDDARTIGGFPATVVLWVAGSVALGAIFVAFAGSMIWRSMNREEDPSVVTQDQEYVPPPPVLGDDLDSATGDETADTPSDDNSQSDDTATDQPETNTAADEPSPDADLDEENALEADEDPDDLEVTPPDLDIPPPDVDETEETVDPAAVVDETPTVPARLPVPAPDTQKVIATRIEEVYPPASYASSIKKVALAKELLELGEETRESDDERFVLYRRAMEVACDAGNAAIMIAAIHAISTDFDVDTQDVQIKMLKRYVGDGKDPARVLGLLKASRELVTRAMADREYQFALQVSRAACAFCDRPVGGSQFRQSIRDDHARIERTMQAYDEFTQAREKLESAPTDAQANLLAGRWYCVVQDDWDHGLPYLARGSDDRLRELANQDLAVETGRTDSILAAADAWWALAQERSGDEQIGLAQRALHWQTSIHPSRLFGIRGAKAQTRKEEIESLLAKSKYSLWRTADYPLTGDSQDDDQPIDGDFKDMFAKGINAATREHDFVAAERWFSRCSKLQPQHMPTQNNYALASVRMREFRRAITLWEKAVELAPSRPEIGHNLRRFRDCLDDADFKLDPSLSRSLQQVTAKAARPIHSAYSTGWLYLGIDSQGAASSRTYEDDRCMFCSGKGDVDCPATGCRRGRVRSSRTDIIGRNSITGSPITKTTPILVPCRTCGGRGTRDCSHCTGGDAFSRYSTSD